MAKNKIKLPRISIDYKDEYPTVAEIELLLAIAQPSPRAEIIVDPEEGTVTAVWTEITKIKFSDKKTSEDEPESVASFGFQGGVDSGD